MNAPQFAGPAMRQLKRVYVDRGTLVLNRERLHALRNHLQALNGYIEIEDKPRALKEWRQVCDLIEKAA